jgi:hypothetical protein
VPLEHPDRLAMTGAKRGRATGSRFRACEEIGRTTSQPLSVIPAQAGTHGATAYTGGMDRRFRGDDEENAWGGWSAAQSACHAVCINSGECGDAVELSQPGPNP